MCLLFLIDAKADDSEENHTSHDNQNDPPLEWAAWWAETSLHPGSLGGRGEIVDCIECDVLAFDFIGFLHVQFSLIGDSEARIADYQVGRISFCDESAVELTTRDLSTTDH